MRAGTRHLKHVLLHESSSCQLVTLLLVLSGHVLPAPGAAAAGSRGRQLHLPDESPAAVRHPAAGGGSAADQRTRRTSCQTLTRAPSNPSRHEQMDPPRQVGLHHVLHLLLQPIRSKRLARSGDACRDFLFTLFKNV